MREVHGVCDGHGDVATASLLEVWIDETERRTWFLFEAGAGRAGRERLRLARSLRRFGNGGAPHSGCGPPAARADFYCVRLILIYIHFDQISIASKAWNYQLDVCSGSADEHQPATLRLLIW